MKSSQFYALMAVMYLTPHMSETVAIAAFLAFGALSLVCRYMGKD